jgi:hypothetical protein
METSLNNLKIKSMENQPTNLDEALLQLPNLLGTEDLTIFQETPEEYIPIYFHHGLGRYLRNNWELWHGSPLAQYFHDLGVSHPDDMSSVILLSFYRKLHGKPILLEQQIERHRL